MLPVRWKNATRQKAFEKLALTPTQRNDAATVIASLGANPRPDGCKKMSGRWKEHYRVALCADFRLIYSISDEAVTLVVIGDRKDIYR